MEKMTRTGAAARAKTAFPASRTNSVWGAAAIISVAFALTGCGSDGEAKVVLSTTQSGYSAVVSTDRGTDNALAAQLTGSLVLGPGGCFEVLDETGRSNWLVYPAGSTVVDGDVPSLKVGNTTYKVGDTVDFGGGFVTRNKAELKVAGTCALESEPFIVHSSAR